MKSFIRNNIAPLLIIFASILGVFIISRLITFSVMEWKILPPFLFATFGNFRIHHFVYGNILITITSFLAIGLGIRKHKKWFALFYGIGLGLVLDEFLLWIGDVKQLTSNTLWVPYSGLVIAIVAVVIATIISFRLYEFNSENKKGKKKIK